MDYDDSLSFFFDLFDISIQIFDIIASVRVLQILNNLRPIYSFFLFLLFIYQMFFFSKFRSFCHFPNFSCSSTNSEWQTLTLFVHTRYPHVAFYYSKVAMKIYVPTTGSIRLRYTG